MAVTNWHRRVDKKAREVERLAKIKATKAKKREARARDFAVKRWELRQEWSLPDKYMPHVLELEPSKISIEVDVYPEKMRNLPLMECLEREIILLLMSKYRTRLEVSQAMGISPKSLYNKMKRHGIYDKRGE